MPKSKGFSIAFAGDGQTLAAGPEKADGNTFIYAWEVETGKRLARIAVLPNHKVSVALSPDGKTIASWGEFDRRLPHGRENQNGEAQRTIQLWDVQSGKEIRRVSYDCGRVHKAAFSPDGRTLAAVNMLEWPARAKEGESCTINLWDLLSGTERCRYLVPRDSYFEIFSYTPDGQLWAAREENSKLQLWDGTTGKLLGSYRQPNCRFRSLSFRADGTILACGAEHSSAIRIWDARTGKVLNADVQGHSSPVTGLAFCAAAPVLMTVSHDGRLCTWETVTGNQLKRDIAEDGRSFGRYRLSPDGGYLTCRSRNRALGRACPIAVPYHPRITVTLRFLPMVANSPQILWASRFFCGNRKPAASSAVWHAAKAARAPLVFPQMDRSWLQRIRSNFPPVRVASRFWSGMP